MNVSHFWFPMVSPREAAEEAGRQYVYQHFYQKGAEQGWYDGWRAAFGGETSAADEEHAAGEDVQDVEEGGDIVMSEEWARRFAETERRRREEREAAEDTTGGVDGGVDCGGKKGIDEGGDCEMKVDGVVEGNEVGEEGAADKRDLYGEKVEEIEELEIMIEKQCSNNLKRIRAPLWPVLPLRDDGPE